MGAAERCQGLNTGRGGRLSTLRCQQPPRKNSPVAGGEVPQALMGPDTTGENSDTYVPCAVSSPTAIVKREREAASGVVAR